LSPIVCLSGFTVCLLLGLFARRGHSGNILAKCGVRRIAGVASALFLAGLFFTPAQAATITEYVVPGNPGLWDLSVDGTSPLVWFTESAGNNIGRLNYADGTLRQIPVPTLNSQPWAITTVDWPATAAVFTEAYANKIGVVARNNTHNIAEYAIPTLGSGPRKLVHDRWRNCTWFTEYAVGKIGRFSFPIAGSWLSSFVEYPIPISGSNPIGIVLDTTGPAPTQRYIWYADFSRKSIVRFLPETGQFRAYSIDPFNPWDLAVDADGMVWFTAQRVGTDENIIGRLNPVAYETSRWALTIFRVPTPNSEVHEVELDSQSNVWFTEFSDYANKIGKYIPVANTFTEYSVITPTAKPQGLAVVSEAAGTINVWFTEYGGRRIGRLRQPEGPTVTTTVYSISYAVTTSSTVLTVTTSPTMVSTSTAVVATTPTTKTPVTASATTASSTIVDTVSTVLTSPTYWGTTYTYTSSTSFTTTTTTYTLSLVSVETTSTTTSITATYVSTSWESVTTLTTATAISISWFSETTSSTTTATQVSTIFSPTVTVPTTRTTKANTTLYSPTVTLTSTTTKETSTTTTSASATTTTSYSPTVTLTSTATTFTTFLPIRPCIIASAAYGSELAPEVQSLRMFRDRKILSTFAGAQFMKIFNAFYYSFSPTVASIIASSPVLAAVVRALVYPLIYILQVSSSVFNALGFAPELGVVALGLFSGALVGIVSFVLPVMGIRCVIRRKGDIKRAVNQALSWRRIGHG